VGYANAGIDEPHFHTGITEIYLVARGKSLIRVEEETIILSTGDVIIVDAGEAHTFLESSLDYLHFVIHVSSSINEKVLAEKTPVPRARLGLQ
jgi:quercetin dioxygenase-like cupin family protein